MVLLIMLAVLIPYLVVGARFARARYALEAHAWNSVDHSQLRYDEERCRKILSKSHSGRGCNLSYSSLRKQGCDCGYRGEWWDAKAEMAEIERQKKQEPNTPVAEMLAWPAYMFAGYLTSGTVDKPNYALIEQLERKELGIK